MKRLLPVLILALMTSCGTRKKVDADTLPKDVALMPARENSQEKDAENMQKLRAEIDGIIAKVSCANPAEWRISPIGSKSCGGPSGYIAYPVKLEGEILPKIKEYTAAQSAFNKKYRLMSDCMMVMPPTEIVCSDAKATLKRGGTLR